MAPPRRLQRLDCKRLEGHLAKDSKAISSRHRQTCTRRAPSGCFPAFAPSESGCSCRIFSSGSARTE
eukprot:5360011-Prymnesium_polylepis.2